MSRPFARSCWLSLLLTVTALGAADQPTPAVPAYGAADFVPSVAEPVGFRADGNGWFPGANPPVEWWEGTPTLVQMTLTRGHGRDKPRPVWDLADSKRKNILWKVAVPGGGDASPIVVGDRVISVYHPHHVVCHDAATGKVLWKDALRVMTLPVLGDDRKTAAAAPVAAKAAAEQTAWELSRATYLLLGSVGKFGRKPESDERWQKRRPRFEKALARCREWRQQLDASLPPSIPKGFDVLIRQFEKVLADDDHKARAKAFHHAGRSVSSAVHKAFKVPTTFAWQGWVVDCFSTPVSDGRLVAVCFPWGQVAAYDVATGKRVWAWRDALVPSTQHMNHGPSPFMLDDLLIVRSGDGQAWMGLDKATGAVRWETAVQKQARGKGANHGNYLTPILMDLPVAGGGTRKALVTQEPAVLDPFTGKEFGVITTIRKHKRTQHGCMVGRDGHLVANWTGDNYSTPTFGFSLSLEGEALQVDLARHLEPGVGKALFGQSRPVYRPGSFVGKIDRLYDPRSGLRLFGGSEQLKRDRMGPPTLCGTTMVAAKRQQDGARDRRDGKTTAMMMTMDVRNPLRPRILSIGNCLDNAGLPADEFWDRYLAGFDKRTALGCYRGLAPWWGCRVGGIAAQGERLYIQSNFGLYCIGPAVKGTPDDDPEVVAAIRAAKSAEELTKHFASPSAQYRYEAINALRQLAPPLDAPLKTQLEQLIKKDPYEEIRAAAILTLDAGSEGTPGWTAYLAQRQAVRKKFHWWVKQSFRPYYGTMNTVRGFPRDDLAAILVRECAAGGKPLDEVFSIANEVGLALPELTEKALALVKDPKQGTRPVVAYLGHTAHADPRALPALRATLGTGKTFDPGRMAALCWRLPRKELEAFLPEALAATDSIGKHNQRAVTIACRRLDLETACRILEQAAAGKDEAQAKTYRGMIGALRKPQVDPRG